MKQEKISYHCDYCNVELKTCNNNLNIVTSKSEHNIGWKRLHIKILVITGIHNDATTLDADLCQSCAISLLKNAVKRVENNERTTVGSDGIEQGTWK